MSGMRRREFLAAAQGAALAVAGPAYLYPNAAHAADPAKPAKKPAATGGAERAGESGMNDYQFKLGMYLPELGLPFDEALATAKQIGAGGVWFNGIPNEPEIAQMSDAQADSMAERVARHNLDIFLLNAGNPFKRIHLTDFDLKTMADHPAFRSDFDNLVRSMRIAKRIGVPAVGSFTFAWPGEYTAGKPTWPMRWLTRGGHIADVDMEKLVKAFSMVAEEAERYEVDVALSMMPWNYTNTTGNFRRLVERVGSKRIKVMWGPADNLNSGESDVATRGFQNVRPYLYGLHIKDLHVIDGLRLKFEYRRFGAGDVDYRTILRQVRNHRLDAVLSVSTHFRPPSGSRVEAMHINFTNLKQLIREIEKGA